MVEHKICKGCQHNNYPSCRGTIMEDGNEMNIETLTVGFKCGQKDVSNPMDFSIIYKTDIELRIEALEEKTKDLRHIPV